MTLNLVELFFTLKTHCVILSPNLHALCNGPFASDDIVKYSEN